MAHGDLRAQRLTYIARSLFPLLFVLITTIRRLMLPVPPVLSPLDDMDKTNQHGYLDEWPNRGGQRLFAARTERGYGHGNRQLEVVARCREALGNCQGILESKVLRDHQREGESDDEIHNKGSRHTGNADNLVHDCVALRSKQHEYRVEQADERPRRNVLEERLLKPLGAGKCTESKASDDGRT